MSTNDVIHDGSVYLLLRRFIHRSLRPEVDKPHSFNLPAIVVDTEQLVVADLPVFALTDEGTSLGEGDVSSVHAHLLSRRVLIQKPLSLELSREVALGRH